MKTLLDTLATLALFLGCFVLLCCVTVIGYVVLTEPLVRGILALVTGYLVSMGLFAWAYDRLIYPIFPWSEK
jgi:hypothetical protein